MLGGFFCQKFLAINIDQYIFVGKQIVVPGEFSGFSKDFLWRVFEMAPIQVVDFSSSMKGDIKDDESMFPDRQWIHENNTESHWASLLFLFLVLFLIQYW